MTVYAITDTKRENRIAPTYLQVGAGAAGAAGAAFSNTAASYIIHFVCVQIYCPNAVSL